MENRIKKSSNPSSSPWNKILQATKAQPKEILSIVDNPTLQYIIEECVASGIEEILIITRISKRSIEDHFDKSVELEIVKDISDMVNIHLIRQKEPRGLGHAILCAKTFIGNEPFAVLIGDDIGYNEQKLCLKTIIK